jgi:hypothetical protein
MYLLLPISFGYSALAHGDYGFFCCGGEWVLVIFQITSSSLKPIALLDFDVGQYPWSMMMGS